MDNFDPNVKTPPVVMSNPEASGREVVREFSPANPVATSTDFLRLIYPTSPWALVSFPQAGGAPTCATFRPEQATEAADWIAVQNAANHNVFYHVNRLKSDAPHKAKKADISEVSFLHVDIDPASGEDLAQERKRIVERLTTNLPAGVPSPTYVVDSGNGMQALWRLANPIILGPKGATPEEVERYTRWLELQFRADSCHNVDRILRLPGTTNWPNKTKLAKGRVPALAKLLVAESYAYELSSFGQAPPLTVIAGEASPVVSGAIKRLDSLDALKDVPDRVKVIIAQGINPMEPPKTGDNSGSAWMFDAVCNLIRAGVDNDTIFGILTDAQWGVSQHILKQQNPTKYAAQQIEKAHKKVAADSANGKGNGKSDDRPSMRDLARGMRSQRIAPLIHLNDDYHTWEGGAYLAQEDNTMRSEAYNHLESVGAKPGQGLVSNVLDALCSLVHLERSRYVPPCWMGGRSEPDPRQLLVCRNGLLDLPTGTLLPHDPAFLTHNALDYDYEPTAAKPTNWLEFLSQVWPGEDEADCIAALQQWFGYLLAPDTSQQKILVMVGPKRSGKGTIARILTSLLGQHNVCAPRLSQFGENFGLQSLIGKQVALVSDLRLGSRSDKSAIAEVLLAISGEDRINVARKNRDDWVGQLRARFVIMSNEPPVLPDPSGALPSRFVVLQMRESFFGREDTTLTDRLLAERPGILNWAIEGWHTLKRAGRLGQPTSSVETVRQIERGSSEVGAFVEDCCELVPGAREGKDALYQAFVAWARREGMSHWPKKEVFGKDLLAAYCGKLRPCRPRGEDGKPTHAYEGIRLTADAKLNAAGQLSNVGQTDDLPF